jgi:hypothetical protein
MSGYTPSRIPYPFLVGGNSIILISVGASARKGHLSLRGYRFACKYQTAGLIVFFIGRAHERSLESEVALTN